MKLSPSFCTQEAGCVYGLFRGLSPHLKNIAASSRHTRRLAPGLACQGDPDGAEVCVWVGVGWGQAPWEGDTKTPGSGPLHLEDYYLCFLCQHRSLGRAHTYQSRLFFLTGEGAALAAWLREPGCLTYIPHCRGAEHSSSPWGVNTGLPTTLLEWTLHLFPSRSPPGTLLITTSVFNKHKQGHVIAP